MSFDGDRAVELAALADLHAHRERRAADAGRRDLGLVALALALLLAAGDVVLPRAVGAAGGRDGELLGDEEVRSRSRRRRLHLAALAELGDVLGQDDLHAMRFLPVDPVPGAAGAETESARIGVADRGDERPGSRRMAAGPGPASSAGSGRCPARTRRGRCPARSSFSSSRSLGTPSRNRSTARTTTTRSSSPPMSGMSSGMRSRPRTR